MKGYIEVMEKDGITRVFYPIAIIRCIVEESDGSAFIETHFDPKHGATGIYTVDSYKEIKLQIQQNK